MVENCPANASGMLACSLAAERIEELISEKPSFSKLTIACLNSTSDCVIGGPLEQLKAFQVHCLTLRVKTKLMNVPYAFHTSAMDPILDQLRAIGRLVKFQRPTIPVMSNVHGRLFGDDFPSDYFADHARKPVRFSDCLQNLQSVVGQSALHDTLFFEIGPHPTLLPMLQASISSSSCTYLGTLRKDRDAWQSISETLSAISLRNNTVRWREVFVGTSAKVTSLPGHLLEGSDFLVPFREHTQTIGDINDLHTSGRDASNRINTEYRLLPWLITNGSSGEELSLETDTTILGPLITGHDVGGTPICPASVFHELAIESAHAVMKPGETQVLVVSEMSFTSPLVHTTPSHEADPTIVRVSVTRQKSSAAKFRVASRGSTEGSAETLHCTGSVSLQNLNSNTPHWMRDQAVVARQSRYFSGVGKEHTSTFRTKILYDAVFTRVVRYSSEYQSLTQLSVADSNLEGIGNFKLPLGSASDKDYLVHPVFTDTLLHAAGFVANLAVGTGEICICSRVKSIEIAYRDIDYSGSFDIYCSLLEITGTILADSIALDSCGKVVAVIRGMEFKKVQLSNFRQTLSRISSKSARDEGAKSVQHSTVATAELPLQTGLVTPPTTDEDNVSSPAESRSVSPSPISISKILKDIVLEVGGFAEKDIDFTMSLCDLGIDSLMQIEMAAKLAGKFPDKSGLSHHALSQCETLEEMDDMLASVLQPPPIQRQKPVLSVPPQIAPSAAQESSAQPAELGVSSTSTACSSPSETLSDSNLLPITLHVSGGNQAPLFLVHDGSGQISMYARLRGHDRTTYGFFDPYFRFSGCKTLFHRSINQMAKHYVSTILSDPKHRASPLILGGKF